jgi:hypothetical protein
MIASLKEFFTQFIEPDAQKDGAGGEHAWGRVGMLRKVIVEAAKTVSPRPVVAEPNPLAKQPAAG